MELRRQQEKQVDEQRPQNEIKAVEQSCKENQEMF